jgi:hypothetical protein
MSYDQLEVIDPNGAISFVDLDPGRGITNIGRHPENDVVLDSPDVADFHAVLDHRHKPYQLVVVNPGSETIVSGQRVLPNVPHALNNWDTIELNGHSLVLVEGSGAAPPAAPSRALAPAVPMPVAEAPRAASAASPEPGPPAVRLAAPPPDRMDDFIVAELSVRDWVIDVEQSANTQLTIVNGGDLVATFSVRVEGIDPGWVVVTPPAVNLFEGERALVNISITPPRDPCSRAGTHYLSVVITSPNYPGRVTAMTGVLIINPYADFSVGELSPRQQTITWRRQTGQASIPIANLGNSDATFRLDGEDDERACRFEFTVPGEAAGLVGHAELRLPVEGTTTVPIRITPHKRRLFGVGKHNIMYTITTTPLTGVQTPRAVLAQVQHAPLIRPWMVALVLLLVAVVLAIIFRPSIQYFGTDANREIRNTEAVTITAGDKVELYWRASPFSSLRIVSDLVQDPDEGPVAGPEGSKTVSPPVNVTYWLRAENLLTRLHQTLFSDSQEVRISVESVLPGIHFTATTSSGTDTVVRGESVTLSWKVDNAVELFLLSNGAPETIGPQEHTGSRIVVPNLETNVYSLQARNRYTGPDGVIANVTIRLVEPTPTPLPVPVIQRFDVQPLVITAGESIRLDWLVTGVDKVTIVGVAGEFAPSGSLEVTPSEVGQVSFVLTASNGRVPVTLQKTVTVLPQPPTEPPPEAPRIEFFTILPSQVVAGDPEANDVRLSWSVIGTFTNISISGPDFGAVANLPRQGSITVAVTKPTLFVLTAFNGEELSASETVQIAVLPPTPTPVPPTPAPTPLPRPIVIFSAAADADRGEPPDAVTAITSSDIPTDTRRYRVVAGTWVRFSWSATNAVKAVFLGEDKAPVDSRSVQITSAGTFLYSAINAENLSTDLFVQIEIVPRPAPPVPFAVNGPSASVSGPLLITWDYDSAALASIDGFKIYRAVLPAVTFAAIADNIPKTIPLQYEDATGGCGMAYYVVAVYTDLNGVRRETAPSSNSWYSQACP